VRLGVRLSLVLAGLGLALIPLTCGLAWYLSAQEIRSAIDTELLERAAFLQQLSQQDLNDAAQFQAEGRPEPLDLRVGSQESGVQFFDENFEPLGTNRAPLSDEVIQWLGSPDSVGPAISSTTNNDVEYRMLTGRLPEQPLLPPAVEGLEVVQIYRDVTSEEQAIDALGFRLALLAAAGVVAVAVTGWFVGRRLAEPVDQLTDVAERLARFDDPPARIETSRTDEIGRLAESFNRMLSALEVGREQQRRLVADASHELRTPLTSLRLRAEFLAGRETVDDLQADMLAGAVVEIEQLSALVDDLVDLAADVRSAEEEPQPTPLLDIATDVATRTAVAANHPIEVITPAAAAHSPQRPAPAVRPTMVRRALQNLVDNAVKYGPADGRITISVGPDRIEVSDEGPGIAAEDVEHVFDRFYRSPKARNRPGNGIGLAIVKQVAEAHRGEAWVANEPDRPGATVGFSVGPQ
jgi:two-component system sensor histidine kinase MprB